MSLSWYLILTGVLFAIGAVTVLTYRSAIISPMGVELILNPVNFVFVTSARILGDVNGEAITFFAMIAAAVEAVVDLAVIVSISESRSTTSIDDANPLKD